MGENATQSIPWDLKNPLASTWSITDKQVDNKATQTGDSVSDVKEKQNKKHLRLLCMCVCVCVCVCVCARVHIQRKPGFLNRGEKKVEELASGKYGLISQPEVKLERRGIGGG